VQIYAAASSERMKIVDTIHVYVEKVDDLVMNPVKWS